MKNKKNKNENRVKAFIEFYLLAFNMLPIYDFMNAFSFSSKQSAKKALDGYKNKLRFSYKNTNYQRHYLIENFNEKDKIIYSESIINYLKSQALLEKSFPNTSNLPNIGTDSYNIYYYEESILEPKISFDVLTSLLKSLKEKLVIEVIYSSRNSGIKNYVLSPTSIFYILNRHHVRAYDHDEKIYKDFHISRIKRIKFSKNEYISTIDEDFNKKIFLEFKINDSLPIHEKVSIAIEWDLEDKESFKIETKKCLEIYIKRKMSSENYYGKPKFIQILKS
jgi:hypothetical protein